MRKTAKLLSALVFAVAIMGALAFGAQEAAACTECTEPPPIACEHKNDPDLFCQDECVNEYDCVDGECNRLIDECICTL